MRHHMGKLCLAAALMLLLSGCIASSVDELYTLPKLPEDYQKLQEKIEQVLAQDSAESAAPLTGELSQSVQPLLQRSKFVSLGRGRRGNP